MIPDLYPFVLVPVYKDYLWGGGRIPAVFGRPARPGTSAESWEMSDREEGMSVVRNGALKGRSLRDLVTIFGPRLIGSESRDSRFPLLIKVIDAGQCLSVQVHPDDHGAALFGGEAKTEMWYVLEAKPGARVLAGFSPGANRESFLEAIARGGFENILHSIPVQRGDAVYVPGGRVHAIDAGCLLLEIQQSSDTTYRVYDWGRVAPDGAARPLHVAQALQVIDWDDVQPAASPRRRLAAHGNNALWQLVESTCFSVKRIDLAEAMPVENDGRSFHALFVAAGCVDVSTGGQTTRLQAGSSCLLAASIALYTLAPDGGPAEVILSSRT